MINLIKNEFKKIFAKKSTYIIFIILILMLFGIGLLNKIAAKSMQSNSYDRYYFDTQEKLESDLKEIEKAKFMGRENNIERWTYIKKEIDLIKLTTRLEEVEDKNWKRQILAQTDFKSQDDKIEMELKAVREDSKILESKEYKKAVEDYEKHINDFLKLTQEEYYKNEVEKYKTINIDLKKQISKLEKEENELINNSAQIKELEKQIQENELIIEVGEIRLEKKIKYEENNFMNDALLNYQTLKSFLNDNEEPKPDAKFEEKSSYYTTLKQFEEAKYMLENNKNISNPLSANYQIKNFLSQHLIIYMVVVIVISGMIVSEEYSKGTIKNLLVKPYRRSTILLSKLIVVVIVSILAFLLIFGAFVLISGILYDFSSIKDSVVQFNANTKVIEEMNLFVYVLRDFAYTLPFVLVITLFTFVVSVITTSSAAAIVLGMISLLATGIVNQIISMLTYNWVKYIPTINWEWRLFISSEYIKIQDLSFTYAIIITIVTYLVFLIPSFIVFKRRDIKNI